MRIQLTVRKFVCRTATCARRIFTERLPALVAVSAGAPATDHGPAGHRHRPRRERGGPARGPPAAADQSGHPAAVGADSRWSPVPHPAGRRGGRVGLAARPSVWHHPGRSGDPSGRRPPAGPLGRHRRGLAGPASDDHRRLSGSERPLRRRHSPGGTPGGAGGRPVSPRPEPPPGHGSLPDQPPPGASGRGRQHGDGPHAGHDPVPVTPMYRGRRRSPKPAPREEAAQPPRHARWVAIYEAVHALQAQGTPIATIARQLGISRPTVYAYLRRDTPPGPRRLQRPPSARVLTPYVPYLIRRWREGWRGQPAALAGDSGAGLCPLRPDGLPLHHPAAAGYRSGTRPGGAGLAVHPPAGAVGPGGVIRHGVPRPPSGRLRHRRIWTSSARWMRASRGRMG